MQLDHSLLRQMSNTVRFLAVDMIEKAKSGHPGMPMGLADAASVFHFHYRHNPKNPSWLNRDRLVFSGGHGSALVYSLLHLWGYDLSIDDLKNFRQFDSKTPGHPECTHTAGVEVTTGPLGQGLANAVGFALASRHAARLLNGGNAPLIDHKVWCFCGDGDMMEGVGYEACSLAGHLGLNNLIVIYDSNDITIDGNLNLSFSEDIPARFRAQKWSVITIDAHNFDELNSAFEAAKTAAQPTLIVAKSVIAKGAATLEGSHTTHGAPLGSAEIAASKAKALWSDQPFFVPDEARAWFGGAVERGDLNEREWNAKVEANPEQKSLIYQLQHPDFEAIEYPEFDQKPIATRSTNHAILQSIAATLPGFLGGSADLASSNKTLLTDSERNIFFGIREHAMAAITNAIAMYGLFIPFNATFFVFSDYLKPAIRTAALMSAKNIFIWTHDSIGVGEDGATHQPIEHISSYRALPNFYLFRPADGWENAACWQVALELDAPSGFVLSRQNLPALDTSNISGEIERGAYLLSRAKHPKITLLASGSEVALALAAKEQLQKSRIETSVVSVPCFDLLCEQDDAYIDSIIAPESIVIAVEAASGTEWFRFADAVIGMETFGASAPTEKLFEHFGFTPEHIVSVAKGLL